MSPTGSDGLSRRLLLGALAAMPALPGILDATAAEAQTGAPLASWNDGPAKQAILDFVRATTDPSSPDFLPPEERIAEFDQDGTLWVEHPLYTQVVFCLDRVPTLVETKPELKGREPFKAVLTGDREAIAKLSMRELFEIVLETQSGMTVEDFRADVREWLARSRGSPASRVRRSTRRARPCGLAAVAVEYPGQSRHGGERAQQKAAAQTIGTGG